MKLQVLRFSSEPDSTSGILMDVTNAMNKKFLAYTIEDEYREDKIRGETRIPAGTYPVVLRAEGGFYSRYVKSYGEEFHGAGMLWIKDVPGFEWILIHKGNDESATMGCLILGNSQESNIVKPKGWVGSSGSNYATTYPYIRDALLRGEKVTIQYVDYDTQANPFTKLRRKAKAPQKKVTKVYEPRKGWWN